MPEPTLVVAIAARLLVQAPIWLTLVVGIVLAASRQSREARSARLALGGLVLLLANSMVSEVTSWVAILQPRTGHDVLLLLQLLFSAGAWGLILAATAHA